jgi:hypothetical protein
VVVGGTVVVVGGTVVGGAVVGGTVVGGTVVGGKVVGAWVVAVGGTVVGGSVVGGTVVGDFVVGGSVVDGAWVDVGATVVVGASTTVPSTETGLNEGNRNGVPDEDRPLAEAVVVEDDGRLVGTSGNGSSSLVVTRRAGSCLLATRIRPTARSPTAKTPTPTRLIHARRYTNADASPVASPGASSSWSPLPCAIAPKGTAEASNQQSAKPYVSLKIVPVWTFRSSTASDLTLSASTTTGSSGRGTTRP